MTDITIRPVALYEAPIVARHRLRMFEEMGEVPPALAGELERASARVLSALLASGEYQGWFAETPAGEVVAGAGVHIKPQLPRIAPGAGRVASDDVPLVVNVWTEPEWRGQGLARALMRHLMDWSHGQGFDRVVLHASDAGRPLYTSLGFSPTNEMRWVPQ